MPRLTELSGDPSFTQVFKATGLTESKLDEMIAPFIRLQESATTILAGAGEIQVHLTGKGKSEEEAKKS
jgi:hypothetical protein